jgi:hypothetical protein
MGIGPMNWQPKGAETGRNNKSKPTTLLALFDTLHLERSARKVGATIDKSMKKAASD